MPYSRILFETDGLGIALVTLHRPEQRYALSRAVMGELEDAFAAVARDCGIRGAIVIAAVTEDGREGMRAFLEKRRPGFAGR